jgi:signal transduction histidine kinase
MRTLSSFSHHGLIGAGHPSEDEEVRVPVPLLSKSQIEDAGQGAEALQPRPAGNPPGVTDVQAHEEGGHRTRWPWSIRTRMLTWYVGLLVLATVASIVVARQVLLTRLDQRIADDLTQEVDELRRLAGGNDPATGEPFGDDVRRVLEVYVDRNVPSRNEMFIAFVGGAPFLTSPDDPPYRLDLDPELVARWSTLSETDRGSTDTPAGRVDHLAVPLIGESRGVFVVAAFRDVESDESDAAIWAAGAVGLAVLLIGSLLAWRLSDRVLGPVGAVTATARRISEGDLTERIEVRGRDETAGLAATFNDMLDRLESAFATQRRFVDDAGHELKTPITIIRGHLELLGDDPADREETLALVLDELDRMSRIVSDLLVLARWEQPDFLQPGPIEVGALIDDLMAKCSALADGDWRLDARAEGIVVADRQRLTQAVVQLAQNAVQHTPPGTPIGIGAAFDGGHLRLWVRDEGPGILADEQERLFERFYRPRRAARAEGAGLGLSIVEAIARAHRGQVELDSRPGSGTTFTIVIPVRAGVARVEQERS